MFVLPFLKYFRPYVGRLVWAVVCMMFVGLLSAAPLLIFREAINVFVSVGAGSADDLGELSGFSSHLIKKDQSKAGEKKEEGTLTRRTRAIRDWTAGTAERLLGRAYTTPRDWAGRQLATARLRFRALAMIYHTKAMQSPFELMVIFAVLTVMLTAIKGYAEFSSKYQLAYTFFLSNLKIRQDIFGNVLRQDYLFFNSKSPGLLHSRINSDVKSVRLILEGLISEGVQQPTTLLAMFIVLLIIDARLTLYGLVLIPVFGGILYWLSRVLRKNTARQKKKEDQISSSLTESLNNIRLVKAFGTEEVEIEKFQQRTMDLFRYIIAKRIAKFGSSPLMEFVGSLTAAATMLAGSFMILHGSMRLGDFFVYLFTLSRFYRPLRALATLTNKYQEARVSAERMIEMLELRPRVFDRPGALPFNELRQGIELRNVGFSYADKRILEGITMNVRAGQRVAFAGPSGAGKTTLVNMLARLFDPSEGAILVDGVDLRELSLSDWRSHLAIVTQDTFLFDDTVEKNIAYGTGRPDPERIQAAARAANAHDFIMDLDGGLGYQTRIGTAGGRLSGGQRQRIAIARAIYRNPRILILDEATSSLDAQSQAVVQEALGRLMAGRTTFVIAHRTSTIRDLDRIYVIDAGRIVEQGSHDELMAIEGGLYRAMVTKVGLISEDTVVDEASLAALRPQAEEEDWAEDFSLEEL